MLCFSIRYFLGSQGSSANIFRPSFRLIRGAGGCWYPGVHFPVANQSKPQARNDVHRH